MPMKIAGHGPLEGLFAEGTVITGEELLSAAEAFGKGSMEAPRGNEDGGTEAQLKHSSTAEHLIHRFFEQGNV